MDPRRSTPIQRRLRNEHVDAAAFLHAVIETAERLRGARAFDGSPALAFDAGSVLLLAIERCGGAPSFADLGRMLGVTAPAARAHVLRAEGAGMVELLPSPDDRRVIQVVLTPAGRRWLEARRLPPLDWTFTLLGGLDPAVMRRTERILRAISERLARQEAEWRRRRHRAPGRRPGA
jgi:DNA-binding MarR family transcriptional regulator